MTFASRVARAVTAGAIITVAHTTTVRAQDDSASLRRATAAVARAQAVQRSGDFSAAKQLLVAAVAACPARPGGRGCRGRINYGLGYIDQLQAKSISTAAGDSTRRVLYADAVTAYRAVLADFPGHADALRNIWLIYATANAQSLDTTNLRAALSADTSRRSGYLMLLGDRAAAGSNLSGARRYYQAAADAGPSDVAVRGRLLSTYDPRRTADADTLFQQARSIEATFPDAAFDAYRRLVVDASPGSTRDRAVVRWATLLANGSAVIDSAITSLGARTDSVKSLADLLDYVRHPWAPLRADHWWRASADRVIALSRVALRVGDQMMADNRANDAERCWFAALTFANDPQVSVDPASLELQRALALLYFGHADLDPQGQKFHVVEDRMFDGKLYAISSHDSLTEQRYHTALGIIYAQRHQWRGPAYAHDAQYQLDAALRLAAARDRAAGTYQPLPLLHELLAQTYEGLGQTANARGQTIQAAQAYLDVDNLRSADSLLKRLETVPAGRGRAGILPNDATPALRRLLTLRFQQTAPGNAGAACGSTVESTLQPFAQSTAFAARQRFKMLADCARISTGAQSVALSARALTAAVSARVVVTGAADLVRLDSVRSTVMGHLGNSSLPSRVISGRAPANSASGVRLPIWVGDEPAFIQLEAHEPLAAKLTETLAPTKGLHLRIQNGGVEILSAPAGIDRARLGEQIKRVPGVAAVSRPG